MAAQRNLVAGFLYKIFINSVFLGWWTILIQIINDHEI